MSLQNLFLEIEEQALIAEREIQLRTLERLKQLHEQSRLKINSQCNDLVNMSLVDEMIESVKNGALCQLIDAKNEE